jgi:hypothetical protein
MVLSSKQAVPETVSNFVAVLARARNVHSRKLRACSVLGATVLLLSLAACGDVNAGDGIEPSPESSQTSSGLQATELASLRMSETHTISFLD